MPYRAASPPTGSDEPEHPYAAVIAAERKRSFAIGIGLALGAAALALSLVAAAKSTRASSNKMQPPRTDTAARSAIAVAATIASDQQSIFERVVRRVVADGVVESGAPCPVALDSESSSEKPRFPPRFPLLLIARSELELPLPSQAVGAMLGDIRRAEWHLESGRWNEATLSARATPARLLREVVLVTDKHVAPSSSSPIRYAPGQLEGRAYLYDFRSHAVVCTGAVVATSSAEVGYAYATAAEALPAVGPRASMAATLDDDFLRATERAVIANLHAVE